MVSINRVAEIGGLIGDPARAAILSALMGGKALTATELATWSHVSPQTVSGHLARLVAAGLLTVQKWGRHRYHRIASADVAQLLESIMQVASAGFSPQVPVHTGPRNQALHRARCCYDHMAGRLGVALSDALVTRGIVVFDDHAGLVTGDGAAFLASLGIPVDGLEARPQGRRSVCRPCLDWSERRPHIAGRLGRDLMTHFLDQGYVLRSETPRVLSITSAGEQFLAHRLGIDSL